jgi:hypothetical protein
MPRRSVRYQIIRVVLSEKERGAGTGQVAVGANGRCRPLVSPFIYDVKERSLRGLVLGAYPLLSHPLLIRLPWGYPKVNHIAFLIINTNPGTAYHIFIH